MFDYNTESRMEHILSAIAGLEELPDYPEQSLTRVERILYAVAKGGGAGVKKGYYYDGNFYKDAEHTELIEPKEGVLYYDLTGKAIYVYDGADYKNIAESGDSDVVDIVNTYADLQNYDTAKLKDRDIVKVLADETHDGKIAYYRWLKATAAWEFVGAQGPYYTKAETDELLGDKVDKVEGKGLSTEDFTTAEKNKLAGLENAVLENTTGQSTTAGMTQKAITDALAENVGKVKVLTTADYNYPENNPTMVALWLLEPGVYVWENGTTTVGEVSSGGVAGMFKLAVVGSVISGRNFISLLGDGNNGHSGGYYFMYNVITDVSNGNKISGVYAARYNDILPVVRGIIRDNLTTESASDILSAKQGKVLKDLIDTRVPQATASEVDKFLKGDGTWDEAGAAITWRTW